MAEVGMLAATANYPSVIVMVEGPAVRKAGNFLDWIAGGLEMNELKGFGNSCPLWTGAPYI